MEWRNSSNIPKFNDGLVYNPSTGILDQLITATDPKDDFPYNDADVVVFTIILVLLAVVGLFTNIITLLVVCRSIKSKTAFDIFIISLCASDLVSALISPLQLYRHTWGFIQFNLPKIFCKIYFGMELATSIATSYHILSCCGFRFFMISRPLTSKRNQQIFAKISIVCIWIFSLVVGLSTYAVWMDIGQHAKKLSAGQGPWPDCSVDRKWLFQFQTFNLYGYLLFYYIPLILVTMLSAAISFLFWKKRSSRKIGNGLDNIQSINQTEQIRQKKENQAILQLILIVISYLIGYVPISVHYIIGPIYRNPTLSWKFGMISYCFLRISECLNPVFYNLGSNKLRRETLKLLRPIFCIRKKTDLEARGIPSSEMTAITKIQNTKFNASRFSVDDNVS